MAFDRPTWSSVALLTAAPPEELGVDDTFRIGANVYWECGHTSWQLMIAWLAGPATLARYPQTRRHHWLEKVPTPAGVVERRSRPVPAEQERAHERQQDADLRHLGLPADRPPGYRWFQVLPAGCTVAELMSQVNMAHAALPDGAQWREVVPLAAAVVRRLYHSPST